MAEPSLHPGQRNAGCEGVNGEGSTEIVYPMLNDFLDTDAQIIWKNERLKRRRILEVFLFGGLAHANPEKKALYDQWASDAGLFPLLEAEFIYICGGVLQAIVWMQSDNKKALTELANRRRGSARAGIPSRARWQSP